MKLIKPSYEIITDLEKGEVRKMLKTLEKVARTCYKSEDKITEDSADKMIEMLIKKGHEAMIEFADIIVKFTCDRGVSHEIVRHRLASYAQESTRYCNYSKDKFDNQVTYIIPTWVNLVESEWTKEQVDSSVPVSFTEQDFIWMKQMISAEESYNALIAQGWQAQQARAVLPNSLKTEINVKFNLREWRHFFKMRCSPAAHPQMRELSLPLLAEFKSKVPILFNDLNF
jgi:thymidylate synthase (FAD)